MITSITVKGWKSFRDVTDFKLQPINILIGQNGAGKSNFLSLFNLLSYGYTGDGVRSFVAASGGANRLLHGGAQKTREIECEIQFDADNARDDYGVRLVYAAGDTLFFAEERLRITYKGQPVGDRWTYYGIGHVEPVVRARASEGDPTANFVLRLIRGCKAYQFHNTSVVSRMRQRWSVSDGTVLKSDGGNLAPVLYQMQDKFPRHFNRLQQTIRLVFPQFTEFVLEPDRVSDTILLQWREKGQDYIFDAAQASDGTLRLFALLTLLMQPQEKQPDVLLFDEPELGLHPAAIELVSEQIRLVSEHTQVIIATQSAYLLNFFAVEDVVVANRHGQETTLDRLSEPELAHWLEEYTLPQLWEKNVIGGKP